ncbi:unnamed protein product [Nesidiocoris tenuis]|uniref:Uncharacterized protein n=1 Tax=Nesidiocoris tenuis TaxID=355587 RepID=A0A6H5H721_9HEMI|nr:unnamed protein product [Nesidiocoris tenuis]
MATATISVRYVHESQQQPNCTISFSINRSSAEQQERKQENNGRTIINDKHPSHVGRLKTPMRLRMAMETRLQTPLKFFGLNANSTSTNQGNAYSPSKRIVKGHFQNNTVINTRGNKRHLTRKRPGSTERLRVAQRRRTVAPEQEEVEEGDKLTGAGEEGGFFYSK